MKDTLEAEFNPHFEYSRKKKRPATRSREYCVPIASELNVIPAPVKGTRGRKGDEATAVAPERLPVLVSHGGASVLDVHLRFFMRESDVGASRPASQASFRPISRGDIIKARGATPLYLPPTHNSSVDGNRQETPFEWKGSGSGFFVTAPSEVTLENVLNRKEATRPVENQNSFEKPSFARVAALVNSAIKIDRRLSFIAEDDDKYNLVMQKYELMKKYEQEETERLVNERRELHERKYKEMLEREKQDMYKKWITAILPVVIGMKFLRVYQTRHAREVLVKLWIPRYRVRRMMKLKRFGRMFITKLMLHKMNRPPNTELKLNSFFKEWPLQLLKMVSKCLRPVVFRKGEFVCKQGDYGFVMYLIDTGKVEIIVNGKGSKDAAAGIVVATLGMRGIHFGEFAILSDEPRMASVRCLEQSSFWVIEKSDLWNLLNLLPSHVAEALKKVADDRRRQNMPKLHKLQPKHIRHNDMFRAMDDSFLSNFIDAIEPQVAREGDVIFNAGDVGENLYFIGRGKVQCTYPNSAIYSAATKSIDAGSYFGEVGVLFLEKMDCKAVALTNSELWTITRLKFLDICMSNPVWFVRAKQIVNRARAHRIHPLPLSVIQRHGPIPESLCTDSLARKLQALLLPRVYDMSDLMVEAATRVTEMFFIAHGELRNSRGAVVSAGDAVGAMEIYSNNSIWSMTYRAVTTVQCWVLQRMPFQALVADQSVEFRQTMKKLASENNVFTWGGTK